MVCGSLPTCLTTVRHDLGSGYNNRGFIIVKLEKDFLRSHTADCSTPDSVQSVKGPKPKVASTGWHCPLMRAGPISEESGTSSQWQPEVITSCAAKVALQSAVPMCLWYFD